MHLFDRAAPLKAWHSGLLGFLLVLPWLQPWSPAPLPNVVPLLVSWACMGLLMAVGLRIRPLDIAKAWAWAALASSAIGLLQYFGQAAWLSPWAHVPDHLGEAMANLRQRNQLATLTSIGILAVLWWDRHGLQRVHTGWMLALLTLGNAATNSRTGLLQMLLVTGLVMGWSFSGQSGQRRLSWRWALAALGMYAVAIWALPQLLSMGAGQDSVNALTRLSHDDGCGSRKVLWRNVLYLIGQKPWWGWGWGELKYAHYSATYPDARFCDILGNAHNGPLHLAFSFGLPLTVLLMVALLGLVTWLRPWRTHQLPHQLAWGVLALIGLHSLLEFPLWYGPFQMAVLLCVWLLMPQPLGASDTVQKIWRFMGLAIVAAVAFVAVDYARVRQIFIPPSQRWALGSDHPLMLAKRSVFFEQTAQFAEFTLTPVTPENATQMLRVGEAMLHYSPEPRVIRKVIAAATLVGDTQRAQWHTALLKAAFPQEQVGP